MSSNKTVHHLPLSKRKKGPPSTVLTVLPGSATQIFEVLFFYMSTVELKYYLQKQPPEMSYKKSCSEKFRKFYNRTL